ncbi:MAG TPA: helix-turn-helix domain-containing protein [Polyangiaceae bacterium]
MRISILALDDLFDTGLTVLLDVLSLANKFAMRTMGGSPRFDVTVVGVRKRVRTGLGFTIPVKALGGSPKPDWVVVPALAAGTPAQLVPALARRDVRAATEQLRKWHAKGVRIAASCIGSFVLAEAGLLDGCEATTTWWLAPLFRERYPNVALDETRMLVSSGKIMTAGAAMGHLDLALWLVRTASPELASVVARYMLADIRSSQAPYIIPNHLARSDELVARFERWSRDHLKSGFSLAKAARALGTSTRTLQRRCEAVLGKSPLSYFQDLRVEHARSLLRSGQDIDAIARQVGYRDGATVRVLLQKRLGRGVRELRSEIL